MFHKVKRSFRKAYIAIIRSRQRRVASETASWLIQSNRDFQHWSHTDLVNELLKKK